MGESAPQNHEVQEALPAPELQHMLPTAEQAEALRPGEQDPLAQLESARNAVEANVGVSNPLEKLHASEAAATAAATPTPTRLNRELKDITLNRELKQIRSKLKKPDQVLSKLVHQKAVRAVSEAGGKTVARPMGLLGGGLVAFSGTTAYLLFARHIGLQYNYFVFLLLFFGGFALGLSIEAGVWLFTRNRHAE